MNLMIGTSNESNERKSVMEVNMTESFEYTYSAKQQSEIEEIRKKYLPKEEDKMETLRRMDREAERPGMMTSILIPAICLITPLLLMILA